jgi:hypothetical protein
MLHRYVGLIKELAMLEQESRIREIRVFE